MKRIRVNKIYKFAPTGWDLVQPFWKDRVNPGDLVRVINLPGAPKAGTMGQCHIACPDTGDFLCMISTASLQAA